jgi:hypothetical protein
MILFDRRFGRCPSRGGECFIERDKFAFFEGGGPRCSGNLTASLSISSGISPAHPAGTPFLSMAPRIQNKSALVVYTSTLLF